MEKTCYTHGKTMADITNSRSLTDFQRNARSFIEGINYTKTPMLLTVNGKVEAVLVDPRTFQDMEVSLQRERFLAAIREGEKAIQDGQFRDAEDVYVDLKAKYDLQS